MRVSVCRIFSFAAAHKLPNYKGPCANLHGHEWVMEVEISGEPDHDSGMVMDFGELKKLVNEAIIDKLDHSYLNDTFANPTAEQMVTAFVNTLQTRMELDPYAELERVRLYENPKSFCEWRRSQ